MLASVRGVSLIAIASAAPLLGAAGCGDGHDYPKGFAEKAALDEKAYLAAEATKPSGGAAAKAATLNQPTAAAPVPATPEAQPPVADAAPEEPRGGAAPPAARQDVEAVVAELQLPAPAPVVAAEGEEPYQKHARDRKFDEFRRKAARYVQLKKQLLPFGKKLAAGTATPEERAIHNRLEDAIAVEFKPLNLYLWDDRWSEADRAAMGWILFVKPD